MKPPKHAFAIDKLVCSKPGCGRPVVAVAVPAATEPTRGYVRMCAPHFDQFYDMLDDNSIWSVTSVKMVPL